MYFSIPPVTWALLITNGVVFLLEQVMGDPLFIWFGLWPLGGASVAGTAGFLPWQPVTYSFLHGSLLHLFFNMFALYMFGSEIERVVGQRRYLAYYFTCVVTAAAAQLMV